MTLQRQTWKSVFNAPAYPGAGERGPGLGLTVRGREADAHADYREPCRGNYEGPKDSGW